MRDNYPVGDGQGLYSGAEHEVSWDAAAFCGMMPDTEDSGSEREITPEELRDIFELLNTLPEDDPAHLYLKELRDIPPLTAEEEKELIDRISSGDRSGASRLTEAYIRLPVAAARRCSETGIPLIELIQEGNLGLLEAAEGFDPAKSGSFSAYASHCVCKAEARAARRPERLIRIPAHVEKAICRTGRAYRALVRSLGREPTAEEIADAVGMTPEKVQKIMKIARDTVPVSLPVGSEWVSLADLISGGGTGEPDIDQN